MADKRLHELQRDLFHSKDRLRAKVELLQIANEGQARALEQVAVLQQQNNAISQMKREEDENAHLKDELAHLRER